MMFGVKANGGSNPSTTAPTKTRRDLSRLVFACPDCLGLFQIVRDWFRGGAGGCVGECVGGALVGVLVSALVGALVGVCAAVFA